MMSGGNTVKVYDAGLPARGKEVGREILEMHIAQSSPKKGNLGFDKRLCMGDKMCVYLFESTESKLRSACGTNKQCIDTYVNNVHSYDGMISSISSYDSKTTGRSDYMRIFALSKGVVKNWQEANKFVDKEILKSLYIDTDAYPGHKTGNSYQVKVGYQVCCPHFQPIDKEVETQFRWSVEPKGQGAVIDDSGNLSLASNAHGKKFKVKTVITLPVFDDKKMSVKQISYEIISKDIDAYDPAQMRHIGEWKETAQIDCITGKEIAPTNPIQTFTLGPDGVLSVGWSNLWGAMDYEAKYTLSQDGSFSFVLKLKEEDFWPNKGPSDIDGAGRLIIEKSGALVFRDLWFGKPHWLQEKPKNCGHRFVKD